MGFLDHFAECFSCSFPKDEPLPKQTVNFLVEMDCEGCEEKIRNALEDLEGVESGDIDLQQSRVSVTGYVDAEQALETIQNTGKRAEHWSYVPYNLVTYPYMPEAYDEQAPPGFVRNVPQAIGDRRTPEMKLMVAFSDENPNACSIM